MSILVIGGTGSIGSFIVNKLKEKGEHVYVLTSNKDKEDILNNILYVDYENLHLLKFEHLLKSIIWAQGLNLNDNIHDLDILRHQEIYNANVVIILKILKYLLHNNKIISGSNLIIISSIWEIYSRDNKLSYNITKSSLSGLVRSLSYDLSEKNIFINNICPGPIDNQMTRNTLTEEQLNYIKNYTKFNRLITLEDLWKVVCFFIFNNSCITGQSIIVDLGFTSIKKYI